VRSIGVVTSGRADYGALSPVLRAIQADRSLQLKLFVTGTHLAPMFGETVRLIEADGFPIAARVDIDLASDTPAGIAHSMARAIAGFAEVFERDRPDVLLVVGDRFEILAIVSAALPFNIPVGHISGGELTEGAIDDSIRHAVTKMSHLHFAAAQPYRTRLLQLGEEQWRVHVTGEPTLDKLRDMKFLSRTELEQAVGMPLEPAPLLVTFHPETLDVENTVRHAEELLAALANVDRPIVFTAPNADTSGRQIRAAIERFVHAHPGARLVVNLGNHAYFSLMKMAAAMVGNSSSGIIEAASFALPVVDVGDREKGRLHGRNVLHAAAERRAVRKAIAAALQPKFRSTLRGMRNPYGSGGSAAKIVRVLKTVPLDAKLLRKRFQDRKPARSR
jgi:UDP-hydrolysing UDP-N-acetyl-D-glucosamine 2-epimerase